MCSIIAFRSYGKKDTKAYYMYITVGHNITGIYIFIIHLRSNIFYAHLACINLSPDWQNIPQLNLWYIWVMFLSFQNQKYFKDNKHNIGVKMYWDNILTLDIICSSVPFQNR